MNLKYFGCKTKAVDIEAGIFDLMPAMETKDRDGDTLQATGARLDNYRRNPVVLWAHDHKGLPVAKALSIEAVDGVGLRAQIQFPPRGVDEFADRVHSMWAAGFLNAASVGFIPRAGNPNKSGGGNTFTEWELLEFSIVPVPANADALRLAAKALDAGMIEKAGRVFSASNESKLRSAVATLTDLLAQLDAAMPDAGKAAQQTEQLPDEVVLQLREALTKWQK